jgi:hypothetical protein
MNIVSVYILQLLFYTQLSDLVKIIIWNIEQKIHRSWSTRNTYSLVKLDVFIAVVVASRNLLAGESEQTFRRYVSPLSSGSKSKTNKKQTSGRQQAQLWPLKPGI